MSQMSKVLSGKKVNDKHSTFNGVAGDVVKRLKKFEDITKIVLGPIRPSHCDNRRIKVSEEKGNVKVQCRDTSSVQTLYVLGVSKEYVEEKLQNLL